MKRALGSFLLWTFTITGLCWGGLAILGHWGVLTLAHPAGVVLHLLGGFGPTVGGLWVFCRGGGRLRQVPRLVFVPRRGTWWVVLLFCLAEGAVIALSSRQFNPQIPLSLVPVVFLQAALIYGGNEEVGWRGTMQPLLERAVPFPGAAVVTGLVWAVWHLPLWFVEGASQQTIPFGWFAVLAVLQSFWYGALFRRTHWVFGCNLAHGLTNTLLSLFVIQVNGLLAAGCLLLLAASLILWYRTPWETALGEGEKGKRTGRMYGKGIAISRSIWYNFL